MKVRLEPLQSLHKLNPKHAEANQYVRIYCSVSKCGLSLLVLLLVVGSHNQLNEEQLAQQQQLAYGRAFSASEKARWQCSKE